MEVFVTPQTRFTLPVWRTLGAAANLLVKRWQTLVQALIVPALLIALLDSLSWAATRRFSTIVKEGDASGLVSIGYFLFGSFFIPLISGLVGAVFAVSCHRIVLLGAEALPNNWGIYWSRRELRFFGWVFLIGFTVVLGFASIFPLGLRIIGESGLSDPMARSAVVVLRNSISIGIVIPVTASIGLVLPATAIDERTSLRVAWSQARGNIFRLATLLAIPVFVVLILSELIYQVGGYTGAISSFLLRFILIILGAVEIIVLSVSYRELVALRPSQNAI